MDIAVLSDSHDRLELIEIAIGQLQEHGITTALHLGDYVMPYVMEILGNSGIQWYGVWGNNDGDRLAGYQKAAASGRVDIVDADFREIELEGRKLFLTHYPSIARLAARTSDYDAVFFGHSHQDSQEYVGNTLLANPGAVSGLRRAEGPSFGIYHPADNTFEIVPVPRD